MSDGLFDAVMAGKLSWGDLMDDDCPTEVEETQR